MELLSAARDGGCNFFDNAEVYAKGQAEEIMGKAIKVAPWPLLQPPLAALLAALLATAAAA